MCYCTRLASHDVERDEACGTLDTPRGTCQIEARTSAARSLLEADGASGEFRNQDKQASEFHDDLSENHQGASAATFNIQLGEAAHPVTGRRGQFRRVGDSLSFNRDSPRIASPATARARVRD